MNAVKKWALPVLFGTAIPMLFIYALSDSASGILNPQIPVRTTALPLETPRASPVKPQRWVNPEPEQLTSPWPTETTTRQTKAERPALPKQTVFNDENFTPKGAVNTVRMPAVHTPMKPEKEGVRVIGIKEERRTRDYCLYPKGSIEHRNCKMAVDLRNRN